MNPLDHDLLSELAELIEREEFTTSSITISSEDEQFEEKTYFLSKDSLIYYKNSKFYIVTSGEEHVIDNLGTGSLEIMINGKVSFFLYSNLGTSENPVFMNVDGEVKIYGNKQKIYVEDNNFISRCTLIENLNIVELSPDQVAREYEIVELVGEFE